MKKLICCFVCVVVPLFAVVLFGKNYLPSWISSHLSNTMGVPISIQRVSFTPHTTQIHQLLIKNPSGCILDTALKVQQILADTSLFTFFHQDVIIHQVTLSELYLGLEFESISNTAGNWTVIINNLQKALGNTTQKGENKRFLIRTLAVRDMNIDLVFRKNDGKIRHLKPIPDMEFKNVSSDGPFPMEQLTKVVMSEILKKVFLENQLKNMLQGIFQAPQGIYNPLKAWFSLEEEKRSRPPLL